MNQLRNCLICDGNLTEILNFGEIPLSNSYTAVMTPSSQDKDTNFKFPLKVNFCKECFHLQLKNFPTNEVLFNNYTYLSGTSYTMKKYFQKFAKKTISNFQSKINTSTPIKILDIACNDCSQLDAYLSQEFLGVVGGQPQFYTPLLLTVGVEPATNICNFPTTNADKKHTIFNSFFDEQIVEKLKTQFVEFDIIIAQNVFAHINYPKLFLKLCKKLMTFNSLLYIQTSQAEMIEHFQFDTMYHEHISFFTIRSMHKLIKMCDLELVNVEKVDVHGISYVFTIRNLYSKNLDLCTQSYQNFEHLDNSKIYTLEHYKNYSNNIINYLENFSSNILTKIYSNSSPTIYGYGSTAKINLTFSIMENLVEKNFSKKITAIIDECPTKIGKLNPNGILIKELKDIDFKNGDYIIILAWNYNTEIKQKLNAYFKNKIEFQNLIHPYVIGKLIV